VSDLTNLEKRKLEKDLGMSSGYVLNFSNRTFDEFFLDVLNIDIYDDKYAHASGSKANRMRAFWDREPNHVVAQILEALAKDWSEYAGFDSKPASEDYLKIVQRLKSSAAVPDIGAIRPNAEEKGFEALAKAVRESIDKNEPEAGLDRLHTFLVKYFRNLCKKHGVSVSKDKPLHSLVGEYIKAIKSKCLIESDITERILKSTISVMEAFNQVRNDHSYAHDNEVLNYHESLLIFGHVTNSVRFIESIEIPTPIKKNQEFVLDDEIPF
jgi:hypothetical protein